MFRIAVTVYAALGFLACSSATSPHKVTVTLSGAPYGLAVSPSGVVSVTLARTGMIARADLPATSFSPVAVVGSVPTAVTFNASGTRAYVTNQFSRTVSVLDPASNTVLHVIPVTGDPFGVRVAPGDSVLWVTTNADSVYALRLGTDSVVAVFPTGSASNGVVLASRAIRPMAVCTCPRVTSAGRCTRSIRSRGRSYGPSRRTAHRVALPSTPRDPSRS